MNLDITDVNPNDRYVWIDLETTGLKPTRNSIIEVAAIITDTRLNELGEFYSLVLPLPGDLENMKDTVKEFHEKNGLLKDLQEKDCPDIVDVEKEFLAFLLRHKEPHGSMYLAGNSLHGVDVPFTKLYMQEIWGDNGGPLHYRTLDVTSKRMDLRILTGKDYRVVKDGNHRALSDVRQCIEEYRTLTRLTSQYYRRIYASLKHG